MKNLFLKKNKAFFDTIGVKQFFGSSIFSWLVIATILAAVAYGILLSGSPGTQRALQLDNRRVSDLQQISYAIDEYWARNEKLPERLETLQDSRYYFVESIKDPETGELYEYQILGEKKFELCAVFVMQTREDNVLHEPYQRAWVHDSGRTCFELEVQPKLENIQRITP